MNEGTFFPHPILPALQSWRGWAQFRQSEVIGTVRVPMSEEDGEPLGFPMRGPHMQLRIGLVGQPKRRRGGICRACEQFEPSIVFRRARDLCSREYREWYIISTRYGLVAPQQVIGPLAPALHTLTATERAAWAQRVADQLAARIERSREPITFVFYANKQYADLLRRAAPEICFDLPLAGLSFPEKLRWYDDHLSIHGRVLP